MALLQPESYKNAMRLNHMAVFTWNLCEDSLEYDEMMPLLLQHEIPKEKISSHLERARLVHPKDRGMFLKQLHRLLQGKSHRMAAEQDFSMEFRVYTTWRCYLWMHMGYRVKYVDGTACQVDGFLQNIHAQHQEKARMKSIVERDPMTGLSSKTHSVYLVNQALSGDSSTHALLVIDLDNFKKVNDKLGHLIGDAVIMDMAMNLKMLFRPSDILGHIGGDEFMVLMRDIGDSNVVQERCNQLRDLLRKSYAHGKETVPVSASIGIALAPKHGQDYQTLFSHADAALYQSKRLGKDRQMVYSSHFVEQREKVTTEGESRQDLQKLLENPKQYILDMAFNSKDTELAVQILLEVFAKYFKVHRAYVFWHVDGPYWPRALFEYAMGDCKKASIAHDAPVRRQIRKRYRTTKYGRFTECSDTSKLASQMARKEFERRQICAYLECAVMDGDKFIGSVGFDDCKDAREWTQAEHEVLQAFADIMRRFLFGQLYYERMKGRGALDF